MPKKVLLLKRADVHELTYRNGNIFDVGEDAKKFYVPNMQDCKDYHYLGGL